MLQLWINATFKASIPNKNPIDEEAEEVRNRRVEGIRVAQLTPIDEGKAIRPTFMSYVMMFARRHDFTSNMAPFATRKYGPKWFTRPFPSPTKNQETKSLLIWEAFLTPKLITLRLYPSKSQVILIAYQPNLVARQFRLIQILPKCLYDRKSTLFLYNANQNKTTTLKQIARYTGRTHLTPISFEPSFLCTPEFGKWWSQYYVEEFYDAPSFTQHFNKAFFFEQEKIKKGTYTHIKEIQAFQNYFQTSYRPDDLSQTIREAAVTLKENISKKMENLKIPSYVPPEKRYEMAFKMFPLKFPRLSNADFGVSLAPSFPDWFICGDSIKILRQQSHKKAQRVVATKYTLDSFKGHLHIGIGDVHIESDIYEGVEGEAFRTTSLY